MHDTKYCDHIGLFYSSKDEQLSALLNFIGSGLELAQKCVYLFNGNQPDFILERLKEKSIDVDSAIQNRNLWLVESKDVYLRGDTFDPDYAIRKLKHFSDLAISENYSGFRIAGEMSWANESFPGSEKLMEYEAKLNILIPMNKITALCQYDMNNFSSSRLIQAIQTHPGVIYGNKLCRNGYYVHPSDFLRNNDNTCDAKEILGKILHKKEPENKVSNSAGALILKKRLLNRHLNDWEKTLEVFKESESYFRKLVNSAPVALIVTDTSGRCLFANEYWQALSGLTVQDSIGIGWQKAIHSEDVGRIGPWWYPGEKNYTDTATECRIFSAGGEEKWIDLKSAPLYDDNGSRIGFIAVFAEITHRKNDKYDSINRIPGLTGALEVK